MTDIVSQHVRSRMMSGIKGKDTRPEVRIRRQLHALGYRFRLHRRDLPGTPDIVLPRHHLVIFVHGCFWHRHIDCFYATSPATRKDFWQEKLNRNQQRDRIQQKELLAAGWRVAVIWECGIKHQTNDLSAVLEEIVTSGAPFVEWPKFPPRKRL